MNARKAKEIRRAANDHWDNIALHWANDLRRRVNWRADVSPFKNYRRHLKREYVLGN